MDQPSTSVGAPDRGAPRQARAVATRARILHAAATEFAAEGYQAAALSKILDRSGVTKGALYFHFESKEAMGQAVYAVMQRRFPEVLADFVARDQDAMTTVIGLAIGLADVLADDVYCRAGLRVSAEGALGAGSAAWPHVFWEGSFVDLLTRARHEGLLRPDLEVEALARTVVALGVGHRAVSTVTAGLADLRVRAVASWEILLDRIAEPSWLVPWRAAGGMLTVPHRAVAPRPAGVPDGAGHPVS